MAILTLKSCMPVLTGNEWRIRVRVVTDDPTPLREVFYGVGARYSLAQAQTFAQNKLKEYCRHGQIEEK